MSDVKPSADEIRLGELKEIWAHNDPEGTVPFLLRMIAHEREASAELLELAHDLYTSVRNGQPPFTQELELLGKAIAKYNKRTGRTP